MSGFAGRPCMAGELCIQDVTLRVSEHKSVIGVLLSRSYCCRESARWNGSGQAGMPGTRVMRQRPDGRCRSLVRRLRIVWSAVDKETLNLANVRVNSCVLRQIGPPAVAVIVFGMR